MELFSCRSRKREGRRKKKPAKIAVSRANFEEAGRGCIVYRLEEEAGQKREISEGTA